MGFEMSSQKIKKKESYGKCIFCEGSFPKSAMTKHLRSCKQKGIIFIEPSGGQKERLRAKKPFHILVEGSNNSEYWMHLNVLWDSTRKDFDALLRKNLAGMLRPFERFHNQ